MVLFHRSLAEDSTDRLNHTWSVALFLLLALGTWFLPLPPVAQTVVPSPSLSFTKEVSIDNIPPYEASCWCPSQFTSAMMLYTNTYCGNAFNQALTGHSNDTSSPNGLYAIFDSPIPIDSSGADLSFKSLTTREQISALQASRNDSPKKPTNQKPKEGTKLSEGFLLAVRAPLTLFLLAVCLKIPHLLWSVLSSCTSFSLDQTLRAAVQAQALDTESRRAAHRDIAMAVVKESRTSPRSLSVLYLIFKLLVLTVAIVELVYVGVVVLPQTDMQPQTPETKPSMDISQQDTSGQLKDMTNKPLSELIGYHGEPLHCDFSVRQLQSVQTFTVQCVFRPKSGQIYLNENQMQERPPSDQNEKQTNKVNISPSPFLYNVIFTAVLAYLVIISVNAAINTLSWLCRLVLGQCGSADRNLPMDVRLVLAMSKENAGLLVTNALMQSCQWGGEKGQEEAALREENM